MPRTNVLIGIGGTGSKIVEAALHLLAAGVGSEDTTEVIIGLVDQDGQNGNCGRAEALLSTIRNLQSIHSENEPNRLMAERNDDGFCDFLHIRLVPLIPAGEEGDARAHWRPEEQPGQTLSSILDVANKDEGRRDLFSLLYADGDSEQGLRLDGGYQARAHLGAAAMRAAIEPSIFHDRISEILNQAGNNVDIRVFLVGSAFGGTGAAGFPTIARHIDKLRRQNRDGEKLPVGVLRCRTGGCLMLPYFTFNDPSDEAASVVRSNETLRNSRVALEYYERFADEHIFDRLYLSGWDRQFTLAYHAPCGSEQENPPLPPELYAAMAAIDFFDSENPGAAQPSVSARHDAGRFGWRDIPRGDEVRSKLGALMRLAAYWRLSVREALQQEEGSSVPLWKRALAGNPNQWGSISGQLDEYFERLLIWGASLRLFAGTLDNHSFDLWDTSLLLDQGDRENPETKVTVIGGMESRDVADAFARLIPPLQPAQPTRSAADLYGDINDSHRRRATGGNRGLGRLIAEIHHAARMENAGSGDVRA